MHEVDLGAEAAAEVERLTRARGLAARDARAFLPDEPLIGIARRNAVRRALGRRVVLLWRTAYADAGGRLVDPALLGATIELCGGRLDVRHTDWSNPWLLAFVDDRSRDWQESVKRHILLFASVRMARERAIAAAHEVASHTFQPGLFDRRADRAHAARSNASAKMSAQLAVRMKAVASAGAISLQPPELVMALVPKELLRSRQTPLPSV